ncbi:TPR-like protein [Periconia macrospinosa]|uniref:TPR-like protein n=1 Tax=Periconia macrospinosa TaxID=97972 RepID=A0A2V1DMG7_9PLEO|nr:TPR-like protein [Periconia macrospinosa]
MLKQKLIVSQDCQKMTVVGLGGTGKTQVALQFAYLVKEIWPECSIFWVPALSFEGFEQAYAAIARELHISQKEEDVKDVVRQRLSSARAGKWLLVLDNADDSDILFGTAGSHGIVDYLPESEEGMTVYTTRIMDVAVSLTRGDTATKELLDELVYLPLAIAQAAAYLNRNRMTIAKYLHLLRNTEQGLVSLMSREFRDDTRYKGSDNAVAATWVVSFSQIQTEAPVAADLLAFMSCIEWKAIPRSLLPEVLSEEQMENAIGTLCGYSFLVRRKNAESQEEGEEEEKEGEEWYDMHRLVHLAIRVWIDQHGNEAEVTQKTTRHVADVFPIATYENRALWRAYLPHALRLLEDEQDFNNEGKSQLCLWVGRCLLFDDRIPEAVKWLEKRCQWVERLDEEDSKRLLASQHTLARAYLEDGQLKKAVELLEHVVAVKKKVLAEDHPDQLASQHALAIMYREDGQVKKSVELLEHVVAVGTKVLVEDHPSRLASQHQLALAYNEDGQTKKAVELLEHVVAVRTKVLAEDHRSRLVAQHSLAVVYKADGQVKKAIELLEHVVAVEAVVLRDDHPSKLVSQHQLALLYEADGQVKKAVGLLEHVVAVRAVVLRDDHPARLRSEDALAYYKSKLESTDS